MEHYLLRPLCMLVRNILLDIYMYLEIYLDIDGISMYEEHLLTCRKLFSFRGNVQQHAGKQPARVVVDWVY